MDLKMFLHEAWCILQFFAPAPSGAAVSGLIHAYLPRSFVAKFLRGGRGVLAGVAVGIPLPLCSCGVIPAALGLKKDGASDGATMGFLISTPQTGVDSIMVSAAFLGWPFAIFKVVGAALTGLVGGVIADKVTTAEASEYTAEINQSGRPGFQDGVAHAMTVRAVFGDGLLSVLSSQR